MSSASPFYCLFSYSLVLRMKRNFSIQNEIKCIMKPNFYEELFNFTFEYKFDKLEFVSSL